MPPLVIIPARAGSKRIPDKNIRALAGASPIERAVDVGLLISELVVVTTDLSARRLMRNGYQADPGLIRVLKRPAELAQDDTPMQPVIEHVLASVCEGDPVVLLQPTQPLRRWRDVQEGLSCLWDRKGQELTSVVSGTADRDGFLQRDGTFYIFPRRTLQQYHNIYGPFSLMVRIAPQYSCNLNVPDDWARAEYLLTVQQKPKKVHNCGESD